METDSALLCLEKDGNVWKRERVNTMKMVAGQVIAYEIQECTLDIQTGKFSFPVDGEKGKIIDAHAVKVDGSSQDHTVSSSSGPLRLISLSHHSLQA